MSVKSLFSFIAGAAAGAAVVWLMSTDEGRAKAEEIKKKAAEGLDEIENAIKDFKAKAEAKFKAAEETVAEKVDEVVG